MAEADTNKDQGGGSGAGSADARQSQNAGTVPAEVKADDALKVGGLKLYVDSGAGPVEVDEKTYFEAAAQQYDVQRLRDMNQRPIITVK